MSRDQRLFSSDFGQFGTLERGFSCESFSGVRWIHTYHLLQNRAVDERDPVR